MGGYGRGFVCYRLLLDRHDIAATAILVCDDDVCELACVESPWLSRCGRYSVWRGNGRQGRRRVTDRVFLLALHRCGDVYAVHIYVKVSLCNLLLLWSYASSRVDV